MYKDFTSRHKCRDNLPNAVDNALGCLMK